MIKKNISILIVCILFLFIYNLFINNIEGGEKSIMPSEPHIIPKNN